MINDIDINKIVVSNELPSISKVLNISFVTEIPEKLDFYAYFVQTWVYIREILIKLDVSTIQ